MLKWWDLTGVVHAGRVCCTRELLRDRACDGWDGRESLGNCSGIARNCSELLGNCAGIARKLLGIARKRSESVGIGRELVGIGR